MSVTPCQSCKPLGTVATLNYNQRVLGLFRFLLLDFDNLFVVRTLGVRVEDEWAFFASPIPSRESIRPARGYLESPKDSWMLLLLFVACLGDMGKVLLLGSLAKEKRWNPFFD